MQHPEDAPDGEDSSDLPSSLPSYMPPSSQNMVLPSSFGYNLVHHQSEIIPRKSSGGDGAPIIPSKGMRGMTFEEGPPGAATVQLLTRPDKMGGTSTAMTPLRLGPPGTTSTLSQISAAQFAASTGGLAMDTALLARVSGTDPSLVGSEEIQQIMRTPDLLSIYQKLQEEDDRRQRRLERNRASARVRREKKKGMVETYEGQVSKLETSLHLLEKHEFGTGHAQELTTALENSSGEHLRHALMSKDAKMELMARILGQHSRNTDAIRRANAENQALIAVASDNSKLFLSLRAQLGLTDEQCQRIASFTIPASKEARKLDVICKCFSALQAHDWLYVPGIETILHQSRNTMTTHQFQKFLSWSVENRPSIDQLQFVPTPSIAESEKDLTFHFSED